VVRLLLAFFTVLFLGGIGAFFLFVPPLLIAIVSIAVVVLFVTACTLLSYFGLGVNLQPVSPLDRK